MSMFILSNCSTRIIQDWERVTAAKFKIQSEAKQGTISSDSATRREHAKLSSASQVQSVAQKNWEGDRVLTSSDSVALITKAITIVQLSLLPLIFYNERYLTPYPSSAPRRKFFGKLKPEVTEFWRRFEVCEWVCVYKNNSDLLWWPPRSLVYVPPLPPDLNKSSEPWTSSHLLLQICYVKPGRNSITVLICVMSPGRGLIMNTCKVCLENFSTKITHTFSM